MEARAGDDRLDMTMNSSEMPCYCVTATRGSHAPGARAGQAQTGSAVPDPSGMTSVPRGGHTVVHAPRPVSLPTLDDDVPRWSEAATTHDWALSRRAMSASTAGDTDSNIIVISSKSCF